MLHIDQQSEEESRKLFRYIDYNNDGVVNKQHVKLFLAFVEGEFGHSVAEANQVFKSL